jgi:CBS-domain-containing membrane protein
MNASSPANTTLHRLDQQTLEAFSSNGILSCAPDAPLAEVAELMAVNRVHAIVIADDTGAEPPVISDQDLIGALATGHFDELTARDVAGTEALSLPTTETVARAAQLLSDHRVSHLIVRNERRYPVGIVSTLDIASAIAQ